MTVLAQALVSGVLLGCFYALLAAGFALIFSLGRVVNLAHGDLAVLGGYVVYWLWRATGLDPLTGLPAAVLLAALLALALQRLTLRLGEPFELNALVVTFGLSLFLQSLMLNLWSADYRVLRLPYLTGTLLIDGVSIGAGRLMVAIVALAVVATLAWLLHRTYLGRAMRALSQDRAGAALVGIHVYRVEAVAFAAGGAMAGAAGVLFAILHVLSPGQGLGITVPALILVILGGVGRIGGLLIGGLALGMAEALVTGVFGAQWREVVVFGLMLAVLRYRTAGLLEATGAHR